MCAKFFQDFSTTCVMSSWRSRVAFPLLAYAFTAIMMGTTLPTPMYALYSAKMHFSVLTTTVVFATYAGGVLAALLVMGRWSDVVGLRPILLLGAAFALASAIVFLAADTVDLQLIGRVLSGLSAGVYAGTATAAVIEAAPPAWRGRAAAVATIANIGGLGLGPLIAGLLVQYAPDPLQVSFFVHIALTVLAVAGVWIAPETSERRGRIGFQLLSVPPEVRSVFVTASTAACAGFAVTGLFTAVVPSFIADVIGISNHAVAGALACSLFAASAAAQACRPNRGAMRGGARLRGAGRLNCCAPEGIRTPNLLIRSQMLYPLSYGRMCSVVG
jgi:MFS family permease